jgi:YfiH family protein
MNIKDNMSIESFGLDYTGTYAEFYFSFDGKKIEEPHCLITTVEAGSMGLNFPAGDNLDALKLMLPGEIFFTANRIAFYKSLGIDPLRVHTCRQIHSQDIAVVEYPESPLLQYADGLVSTKEAILGITAGDCLPVYLYDTKGGGFSLCHSGWKGTGIVKKALTVMKAAYGTEPEYVSAILGPCIRGDDYEVDAERAREFNKEFGCLSGEYPLGEVVREISTVNNCTTASGGEKKYYLDLQAANARILACCGVRNIKYCTNSTLTDTRLGSFRREGKEFIKMMALVGRF